MLREGGLGKAYSSRCIDGSLVADFRSHVAQGEESFFIRRRISSQAKAAPIVLKRIRWHLLQSRPVELLTTNCREDS